MQERGLAETTARHQPAHHVVLAASSDRFHLRRVVTKLGNRLDQCGRKLHAQLTEQATISYDNVIRERILTARTQVLRLAAPRLNQRVFATLLHDLSRIVYLASRGASSALGALADPAA